MQGVPLANDGISFFAELKRRNVYRVGIAYVVVAWLALQALDIIVPIMRAPEWFSQLVLILLVIGLPFALIFAWAFEMTPEGLKREKDVLVLDPLSRDAHDRRSVRRKRGPANEAPPLQPSTAL